MIFLLRKRYSIFMNGAFFKCWCNKIIDYIMIKYQESESQSAQSEDDQYSLVSSFEQKDTISRHKSFKSSKDIRSASKDGKWTDEQNLKYVLFMDYYQKIFASKQQRKSLRIFKSLSSFLGSRTARQCRSHFQKIMNKFKKLKKIKQYYQQLIGSLQYQEKFEQVSLRLQNEQKKESLKDKIDWASQTEQIYIKLFDLPNENIIRLMSKLSEFIRPEHFGIMSNQNRLLRESLLGNLAFGPI